MEIISSTLTIIEVLKLCSELQNNVQIQNNQRLTRCIDVLINELQSSDSVLLNQTYENLCQEHGRDYVEDTLIYSIETLESRYRAKLLAKLFKYAAGNPEINNSFFLYKNCVLTLEKTALEALAFCFSKEQEICESKETTNACASWPDMEAHCNQQHLIAYISANLAKYSSLYGVLGFQFLKNETRYLISIIES